MNTLWGSNSRERVFEVPFHLDPPFWVGDLAGGALDTMNQWGAEQMIWIASVLHAYAEDVARGINRACAGPRMAEASAAAGQTTKSLGQCAVSQRTQVSVVGG